MKYIPVYLIIYSIILFFSQYRNPETGSVVKSNDTDTSNSVVNKVEQNWKIGPQMWSFRMFTFAEALDKTDSAGLKYIEAFWGQPLGAGLKDSFGINMSQESRTKIKELLQSKGISITAMGVIGPGSKAEWQKAFELAGEFGMSYITAEPQKDQWDFIDSLAGTYNIRIAIHDHPRPSRYWHPDSVLAAIRDHRYIGACADVGHWARSGLDPVECLKKLDGYIYGVHLKDIKVFGDTHAEDTIVSRGVIDFPEVFTELKRQKFNGLFSIEHESNWYNNLEDIIFTAKYFKDQVERMK